MVLSFVIALGLTAGPVKIASVGLSPAGGVSEERAEFVSEHFAARLATAAGLEVTSRKAIGTLLGLERERQLLGCADDSSACLAELAGALGAEVVLVGELAQLDHSVQVNVRAMEARTARVLHSAVVRGNTQEQLLDRLDDAARDMAVALQDQFGIPRPTRWQPWVVVGAGLVTAGVGGIFLAQASHAWSTLNAPATAQVGPSEAATLAQQGSLNQGLGIAFVSLGAALVAGGLTWFALGHDGPALAVALAPGSGLVTLSWRLP